MRILVLSVIAALVLPWRALAAVTVDTAQSWEAEAGSGAGGSITVGASSNRALLICRCIRENGGAVAADTAVPTVGGNNATQIGTGVTNASNVMRTEAYIYLNPPIGSNTVATFPAASTDRNLTAAISLFGVHQTVPTGTPSTNQASSSNMDVNSIASDVGDLVALCGSARVGAAAITATPDATSPASTERIDTAHSNSVSSGTIVAYTEDGASTSTDVRVDLSESVQWAALGVAIKPAPVSARNRGVVMMP